MKLEDLTDGMIEAALRSGIISPAVAEAALWTCIGSHISPEHQIRKRAERLEAWKICIEVILRQDDNIRSFRRALAPHCPGRYAPFDYPKRIVDLCNRAVGDFNCTDQGWGDEEGAVTATRYTRSQEARDVVLESMRLFEEQKEAQK